MITMFVATAVEKDIPGWLRLAAEVEPLFGPMVNEPGFQRALYKNIARGTAFCIRENNGEPGAPLMGGLLFSPRPPIYTIGWLAVTQACKQRGVGRLLVDHAIGLVQPPAEMILVTFAEGVKGGAAARRFYEKLGFLPAERAPSGPEGGDRQVYRRVFR
jgi:ribosomal protein S18 acetylase RimI-like enzyme